MVEAIHGHGWHFMLHTCGRVNAFVPYFLDLGIDVLNMQQPRAYGIRELGRRFAGKVCFLTTADIQATMPSGDLEAIRAEVRELVEHWSTPRGGLIVFNYGHDEAIGTTPEATAAMFREFARLMQRWSDDGVRGDGVSVMARWARPSGRSERRARIVRGPSG